MKKQNINIKAEDLVFEMTNTNIQSKGLTDDAEIEKIKEENYKAVSEMLSTRGIMLENFPLTKKEEDKNSQEKHFIHNIINKIKTIPSAFKNFWKWIIPIFENRLVIISLIYVLFYSMWENIINNSLVKLFFSHFEQNIACDIVFYLLSIGCIINTCYSKPKRYEKRENIIACAITFGFWVYFRFFSEFDIYSLVTIPILKYIDIVAIFSVCKLVSCIFKNIKKTNFIFKDGFERDIPIDNPDDDIFKRNDLAQDCIEKLLNTDTSQNSFSFGIVSPWGAGKTSFMNLMKKNIDDKHKDECIVIKFNPWLYSHEANIITIFFNELSKALKQFRKLANEFNDYSKALSIINTPETKIATAIIDYIKPSSKLQDKIDAIKDSIQYIDKKIVIFVDDIDRLNSTEIMEVLKLIRNISNFPYMYFIVAYDKEYILECLKEQIHSKELDYTEKIFQVEYQLPNIETNIIKKSIIDSLSKFVTKDDNDELVKDVYSTNTHIIEDCLSTIRDVKRIVNSFYTSYSRLKGEVVSSDLFVLEILKTKYPTVYSILETDRKRILKPSSYNCYELFDENKINNSDLFDKFSNVGKYNIIKFIEENEAKLQLKVSDKEKIEHILLRLFPASTIDNSDKAINNIFHTDRYFSVAILESDLSDIEFDMIMQDEDINQIKNKFEQWSTNKSNSLSAKLKQFVPNNQEEQKKYIRLLIFSTSIMQFDVNYVTEQINKLKEGNTNTLSNENKKFIKQSLCENGYSVGLGKYLYSIVFGENPWDYPLSREELNEVKHVIFKECIKQEGYELKAVIQGFLNTYDYFLDNKGQREKLFFPKNAKIMKQYVKSHIEDFVLLTIDFDHYFQEKVDHFTIVGELPLAMCETWDNYKGFINGIKDTNPIIKEYKKLLEQFSHKNYSGYVYYTSEHINYDKLVWHTS